MEEQRFEMIWDCRYCGNKKMLARTHRHCTTCGAPQDPTWRYFPDENEAIAVLDATIEGADVICPACKSPNAKSAEFCRNCAAPLTEAASVKLLGEQSRADGQSFAEEDLKARRDAEKALRNAPTSRPSQGNWTWLLAVAVLIIGAIWWFSRTKETTASVTGHSWQREIKIERFSPIPASAWCDSTPLGAYNIRQYRDVRSTRQVADGQTCRNVRRDNGDGTYSQRRVCSTKYRSEPVYGLRCDFVINTWTYSRSAISNGSNLESPVVWANSALVKTGTCLGCERENGRTEKYSLGLVSNQQPFNCDVAESLWRASPIGAVFQIRVNESFGNALCGTLKSNSK